MLLVKPKVASFFSGAVWLSVGMVLFTVGLRLLLISQGVEDSQVNLTTVLFNDSGKYLNQILVLLVIALVLGFFKGKYALSKTAFKHIDRLNQSSKISVMQVYSSKQVILIGLMICLGIGMRVLGISLQVRGMIDVIVGVGLIQGSLTYFRGRA